ncbi:MAG: hypothetical protein SWJ54_13545 [Cyanobacteriota bacterium]|nr:hypothetical protein [Cyanobacteriota bacterium]
MSRNIKEILRSRVAQSTELNDLAVDSLLTLADHPIERVIVDCTN